MTPHKPNDPRMVLHWYDFVCPFCYIGQQRNKILLQHGLGVIELPFQAHPEIPAGGIDVGPRIGPLYTWLETEAKKAGLPLHWPSRLPNTRDALAAAEWTRRHHPRDFPTLRSMLFQAHFALSEDLGDRAVIARHASAAGIDVQALQAALVDGSALGFVRESEELGLRSGVQGTPAWLFNRQLISGLRSAADFETFAEQVIRTTQQDAPLAKRGTD